MLPYCGFPEGMPLIWKTVSEKDIVNDEYRNQTDATAAKVRTISETTIKKQLFLLFF